MLLRDTPWTKADTFTALSEGWMVFNGCEIQRDDETGLFATDDDAIEHVRRLAAEGSHTHMLAIDIHDSNMCLA